MPRKAVCGRQGLSGYLWWRRKLQKPARSKGISLKFGIGIARAPDFENSRKQRYILVTNLIPSPGTHAMKIIISLILAAFAVVSLNAQARPTSAADYKGTIQYAVFTTNEAFPFVFTVVTEKFEGGKLVSTETEVNERQAAGVARETKTLKRGETTLHSHSIMVGFGNNTYCSTDGVSWSGPQKFVCPGPERGSTMMLSMPREPESAEYSVEDASIGGKPVKIYRKYAVFAANTPNGKKTFEEETATIDSRGFFISVIRNKGTLGPKVVTSSQKQTWDFNTKFKPVVAPK